MKKVDKSETSTLRQKAEKRTFFYLLIIFVLFAAGTIIIGIKYFKGYKEQYLTEVENQITADLLAEIAGAPAALIMRVHAHEIEVFVASHSPSNVYHPGEKAQLNTGLYCETVMSTQSKLNEEVLNE
jgi:hypothetical protein